MTERPNENDTRFETICGCKRDCIKEVFIQGSWLPVHSAWTGGSNFGSLEMAGCCAMCAKEEHDKMRDEADEYGWY